MLVPTKELADQVYRETIKFTVYCSRLITCINLSNGDASLASQRYVDILSGI